MKATFSLVEDGTGIPRPCYDLAICFNGVPDTVVLEITRTDSEGYSGSSDDPITTVTKRQARVMRAAIKGSHARAIASALLSAATEVKA